MVLVEPLVLDRHHGLGQPRRNVVLAHQGHAVRTGDGLHPGVDVARVRGGHPEGGRAHRAKAAEGRDDQREPA